VLAFQRYRRQWYPLPLSKRALHDHLNAGTHALPRDPQSGEPSPFTEETDAGRYGFGFVIAPAEKLLELAKHFRPYHALPESILDEAARIIADLPFANRVIYRIDARILR
jgi:hypothetical protein